VLSPRPWLHLASVRRLHPRAPRGPSLALFNNRVSTALPYLALYARDLRLSGYRAGDVLRVFALNLMLIPVNLGGVLLSVRQACTGKSPFGRTPKIQGRTAAPPRYVIAEIVILANWLAGIVYELLRGRPLHAGFAFANAAFLAYAIVHFIGPRECWSNFARGMGIRASRILAASAPAGSMRATETDRGAGA
jgi:hypothetical protein